MVKQRRIDQLKKMEEEREDKLEVDHDDFTEVIEKFKRKPTKTYDFLIKIGKKYQQAVYKLCKRIIDQEEVPDNFRKTILYMIWKKEGSTEHVKE